MRETGGLRIPFEGKVGKGYEGGDDEKILRFYNVIS